MFSPYYNMDKLFNLSEVFVEFSHGKSNYQNGQ